MNLLNFLFENGVAMAGGELRRYARSGLIWLNGYRCDADSLTSHYMEPGDIVEVRFKHNPRQLEYR